MNRLFHSLLGLALTGGVLAGCEVQASGPAPVVYAPAPVVVYRPAPPPVVVYRPAPPPVYYRPPPVVYHPVYHRPPPPGVTVVIHAN